MRSEHNLTLPKTNISNISLKIGLNAPKGKFENSIPTIHFQGQAVSFRGYVPKSFRLTSGFKIQDFQIKKETTPKLAPWIFGFSNFRNEKSGYPGY